MKKTIIALTLVLAIAIALSITIPALAATTANTSVQGTIAPAIDISVDKTFVAIVLVANGDGTSVADPLKVTVLCNAPKWDVAVAAGDMTGAYTSNVLDPLEILGGDITSYEVANGNSLMDQTTADAGQTDITGVTFQQATTYADEADSYSATVTFTASIN